MRISVVAVGLAGLFLGGCAAKVAPEPPRPLGAVAIEEEPEWLGAASTDDASRIQRLDQAWSAAISSLRSSRERRVIAQEGRLLDPKAALPRPAPPPGSYHCRLLRFGGSGRSPYTAFRPFFCHVGDAGPLLAFTKQTGSDRPAGYFYPDSREDRLIFLGTLNQGSGEPLPYDGNSPQDMVGVVQRVDSFRWRLVIPWPRSGGTLEVMELVPALP